MGILELITSIFVASLLLPALEEPLTPNPNWQEKKTLEKNKASEKNQQRKEVRANIQSWHHEEGKDVFSVESQLSKT